MNHPKSMFQLSGVHYNKEPPKIVLVIILAPILRAQAVGLRAGSGFESFGD